MKVIFRNKNLPTYLPIPTSSTCNVVIIVIKPTYTYLQLPTYLPDVRWRCHVSTSLVLKIQKGKERRARKSIVAFYKGNSYAKTKPSYFKIALSSEKSLRQATVVQRLSNVKIVFRTFVNAWRVSSMGK